MECGILVANNVVHENIFLLVGIRPSFEIHIVVSREIRSCLSLHLYVDEEDRPLPSTILQDGRDDIETFNLLFYPMVEVPFPD